MDKPRQNSPGHESDEENMEGGISIKGVSLVSTPQLHRVLGRYGHIKNIVVKGFECYVTYKRVREAIRVIKYLNGKDIFKTGVINKIRAGFNYNKMTKDDTEEEKTKILKIE